MFFYFDVIICQRPIKKLKLLELFFSSANDVKTCGLGELLILRMLRDLILESRDSHSLNGGSP